MHESSHPSADEIDEPPAAGADGDGSLPPGGVRTSGSDGVGLHPVRLLEVDPELSRRLPENQRARARRHVVLAAITLDPGRWELERLRDHGAVHGEVRGFLVLDGALTTEVTIAGRTCTRLLGPQELALVDGADGSVAVSWGWSVLQSSRIAILDDRLLVIAQRWPQLLGAILKRAGRQSQAALIQQAISQLPRVEDRLLTLMWSIADRWGTVRSDGVWVGLTLTHETIAKMIGARRPTVSLGLRTLVEQGLLSTDGQGWLLDRASLAAVSPDTHATAGAPAPASR